MKDHAALVRRDHDDVVEGGRAILDERQDRTPPRQLCPHRHPAPGDGRRVPSPAREVGDQRVRSDARSAAVDEAGKRFGRYVALAPVAQHHGGRGAAAQQLGLGNEGNVEKLEGRRRWFLRVQVQGLRRHDGGAAQGHGPHQAIS